MKNIFRISLLVVFLLGMNANVFSQVKLGHINTNELLQQMPGRETATKELEKYAGELESTFTAMQREFQTKYQDYLEKQETFSQLIRQSKERELESLQQRIMEFQESAQEDLMQKENQLLRPIIEKARKAIEDVARENGFTYVFDTSMGVLLYSEPSDNIMDKVKAKIGI
ncbi:MAG: OmpH family outer membrane protein [Bacteroidetes bacterium]|nr:MAG: OmpH family outer membrane protein [Bacteroidota bacterium]